MEAELEAIFSSNSQEYEESKEEIYKKEILAKIFNRCTELKTKQFKKIFKHLIKDINRLKITKDENKKENLRGKIEKNILLFEYEELNNGHSYFNENIIVDVCAYNVMYKFFGNSFGKNFISDDIFYFDIGQNFVNNPQNMSYWYDNYVSDDIRNDYKSGFDLWYEEINNELRETMCVYRNDSKFISSPEEKYEEYLKTVEKGLFGLEFNAYLQPEAV